MVKFILIVEDEYVGQICQKVWSQSKENFEGIKCNKCIHII